MTLNTLRQQIDTIDDQIVALLNKRFDVIAEIKAEKAKTGHGIHDPQREEAAMKRMLAQTSSSVSEEMLRHMYDAIFAASRKMQKD